MEVRALARNLIKLREEKGWSQEDLADEAGLHRTYVSGIEAPDLSLRRLRYRSASTAACRIDFRICATKSGARKASGRSFAVPKQRGWMRLRVAPPG